MKDAGPGPAAPVPVGLGAANTETTVGAEVQFWHNPVVVNEYVPESVGLIACVVAVNPDGPVQLYAEAGVLVNVNVPAQEFAPEDVTVGVSFGFNTVVTVGDTFVQPAAFVTLTL